MLEYKGTTADNGKVVTSSQLKKAGLSYLEIDSKNGKKVYKKESIRCLIYNPAICKIILVKTHTQKPYFDAEYFDEKDTFFTPYTTKNTKESEYLFNLLVNLTNPLFNNSDEIVDFYSQYPTESWQDVYINPLKEDISDSFIEPYVEEAEKYLADKFVSQVFPQFNWERFRRNWKFLTSEIKFAALTRRRIDLTGKPNAVISRELLSSLKPNLELVFTRDRENCTIKNAQISSDSLPGDDKRN